MAQRKQSTFKDLLRGINPDDKKAIVEAHVKAALHGSINSLTWLLQNAGEGSLDSKLLRIIVTTDGRPCSTCGVGGPPKRQL